ncbi:unnamed protein product, partial [Prorocentrum cordatum]
MGGGSPQALSRAASAGSHPVPRAAAAEQLDARSALEVLGINGNTSSARAERPHLVMLQEIRSAPQQLGQAAGRAKGLGDAAFLHAAAPPGNDGPLAHSGGAASKVQRQVHSDLKQRMIRVTVSAASGLEMLASSLYVQDSLGPKGINLEVFAVFGGMVLPAGLPRLTQSDFNMAPGTLSELGWPRAQRGAHLGPAEPTCIAQGAEHVYDRFASSHCLARGVATAEVLDGSVLFPHKPAHLLLQDARPDALALARALARPARFPDVDAEDCKAHEDAETQLCRRAVRAKWETKPVRWHCEVGSRPPDFAAAVRHWTHAVEGALVGAHVIRTAELKRYLGREHSHKHSALARRIRQALGVALQRLTARRARRWHATHQRWHEQLADRCAALLEGATAAACIEDEVGALSFDTSEWRDLTGQAGDHMDTKVSSQSCRRAMLALSGEMG